MPSPAKPPDLDEVIKAIETVGDDVIKTRVAVAHEDTPLARRTYVRTVFSYIEAWMFATKQMCLSAHRFRHVAYPPADLAILREESYSLARDGEAIVQTKYLKLDKHFRFVFRVFARSVNSNYQLNVQDPGWGAFLQSITLRNRLTHPRSVTDLEVSDEDFETMDRARGWFQRVSMELYRSDPNYHEIMKE
jgi:hypothetical protein